MRPDEALQLVEGHKNHLLWYAPMVKQYMGGNAYTMYYTRVSLYREKPTERFFPKNAPTLSPSKPVQNQYHCSSIKDQAVEKLKVSWKDMGHDHDGGLGGRILGNTNCEMEAHADEVFFTAVHCLLYLFSKA